MMRCVSLPRMETLECIRQTSTIRLVWNEHKVLWLIPVRTVSDVCVQNSAGEKLCFDFNSHVVRKLRGNEVLLTATLSSKKECHKIKDFNGEVVCGEHSMSVVMAGFPFQKTTIGYRKLGADLERKATCWMESVVELKGLFRLSFVELMGCHTVDVCVGGESEEFRFLVEIVAARILHANYEASGHTT